MTVLVPFLAAFVTFGGAEFLLARRETDRVRRRVGAHLEPVRAVVELAEVEDKEVLLGRFERPLAATEARLRKLPYWAGFAELVDRADVRLQPVEIFYVAGGGSLLLGLFVTAAGAPPAAAVLLVLASLLVVRLALKLRIERRRRAFEEQLPELLSGLASALRAGHGLNQALQAVAADSPEPTANELGRLLSETRLGRPLEDALLALGKRVGSEDLDFVLDAIVIQRQVGGSLAGIFEIVAESVRQRQQFVLKIRALTAMGRTSAGVLLALPLALGLLLSLIGHGYMSPLFSTHAGRVMIVMSLVLMSVGTLWLRKIVGFRG